MNIKLISKQDFQLFWPTFQEVIQAEETYAFEPTMGLNSAYELWCEKPQETYVIKDEENVVGSYYIKSNSTGPSSHICNCGYMVAPESRGKGIARKLCEHSQERAAKLGYKAMQFNAVVSTNLIAVNLWKKLGFEIVGTVPNSYRHKKLGFVDTFVMYKWLEA